MDGNRPLLDANAFLWKENDRLRQELQEAREQLPQRQDNAHQLQKVQHQCDQLRRSNHRLRQRVAELTEKLKTQPSQPSKLPPWVKPNTRLKRHKRPGQKPGHAAALRPKPQEADVHREVPLPVDKDGKISCPHCNTQLNNVHNHQRWVEEVVPSKLVTISYHTTSGYCPCCRKTIESRADEQPPPADIPHAQLGLNALSTAAVMRVCYRMPLRQIKDLTTKDPKLAKHLFFKRCRRLVKDMLRLSKRREEMAVSVFEHQVQLLEKRLGQLGTARWDQPDARRLAKRLAKHRDHLTTFLHNPLVEPTNNHAERALRPAVVHRKITGGSRSAQSAQAWAILASIMQTARQQNQNVLQTIQTLLKDHWAGRDSTLLTDLLLATPATGLTARY